MSKERHSVHHRIQKRVCYLETRTKFDHETVRDDVSAVCWFVDFPVAEATR